MMERQRVDQGPETKPPRALRDGSKEHARRRRHAKRGRVMLGNMVRVEARLVISLDELEAGLVKILQRQIAAI